MKVLIYTCEDAPPKSRCCAVTIHDGARMPVVHYAATPELAQAGAIDFWEKESAKALARLNRPRKTKATDVGDVI